MKIKVAFLGLFLASGVLHHSVSADPYRSKGDDPDPEIFQSDSYIEKQETKPEDLVKLGLAVTMSPAILYEDSRLSAKNSPGANLTFKADVPQSWCDQNVKVDVGASWGGGKDFTIKKARISLGKILALGHTSTIFGYEKAEGSLLISPGKSVLQISANHSFDWFKIKYALERSLPLKVGSFDKTISSSTNTQNNNVGGDNKIGNEQVNKLDDEKNNKRSFKIKNNLPALGLTLGVVTDEINLGITGLGRFTDYTYSSNTSQGKLDNRYLVTYGGNLGVHYQIIAEKLSITGQGVYVHGLGDYLPGLGAVQDDEVRKEMAAVYYLDQNKDELNCIDAFGVGGALEYCFTSQWAFSVGSSYLKTLEENNRPGTCLLDQWNCIPKLTYKMNKYFTFYTAYAFVQEYLLDKQKNKEPKHKLSGTIKFSL